MRPLHINSRELMTLCRDRDEVPHLVAQSNGGELYRFEDGTEVIVTNAGLATEDDQGFAELRASILGE